MTDQRVQPLDSATAAVAKPLNVLIVEDVPADAWMVTKQLIRAGHTVEWSRVDTEAAYRAALNPGLDVILSDCVLPGFSPARALQILRETGLDVPFILVSGTIGEEAATELMRQGAVEFVPKDKRSRLGTAVSRAMAEAQVRRERSAAIEGLRRAEALYRGLFENSVDGIFQSDADGRIVMANAAYLHIFEVDSMQELLVDNQTFDQALLANDRIELARLLKSAGRVQGYECRCRLKNGVLLWLNMNVTAVTGDDGMLAYYEGSVQDATSRKLAEVALVRSEGRFKALFESNVIGIVVADRKGKIFEANEHFLTTFGRSRHDLPLDWVSMTPDEFRSKDLAVLEELRLTGQAAPWEKMFLDGAGRRVPVLTGAAMLPDDSLICFIVDLTEIKSVQANLEQAKSQLEHAISQLRQTQESVIAKERLHALGEMSSGIAHDFNNSLSPIVGLSELLITHPAFLDDRERVLKFLSTINQAGRDAAKVVSRLREFYRPADDVDQMEVVALKQVVEQAIEFAQPRWADQAMATDKKYRITTNLKDVRVAGQASELREMLVNLIFNSLDAMPNGGELGITIDVDPSRPGVVRLEVSDTGAGMTADVKRRCLEPFFTTKGARGTGLGLATSYGIAKRHHGEIEIDSEPGRGTRIGVTLPTVSGISAEEKASELPASPIGRALRILVVEDEEVVRDVIAEYLHADGHDVDLVDGPAAGLARIKAGQYDLIVTDRAMPDMSGEHLALEAKRLAPDTPVLMLTGFGEFMNAAGERPVGVDAVASKPISIDALREAIAKLTEPALSQLLPR